MAIGQMAVAGDGNRILRGVFTGNQVKGCSSLAVRLWDITPPGVGLTGRGWNIPFPCRSRFPLNGIYRSPPPPGRSAASSRPLERGRAVYGDWTDGRGRGREQDSGRVFTLTVERLSVPRQCVDGISAPAGEGMEHFPPPVSACHRDSVFPQATPTSGHAFAPPRNTCFFRQIHHNQDRSYLQ